MIRTMIGWTLLYTLGFISGMVVASVPVPDSHVFTYPVLSHLNVDATWTKNEQLHPDGEFRIKPLKGDWICVHTDGKTDTVYITTCGMETFGKE